MSADDRVRKLAGAWTVEVGGGDFALGSVFQRCTEVEIDGAWIRFRTKDGILMHVTGTVILKGEK